MSTYHLYILQCADDTLYTGITMDVARRVREHNTSVRVAEYTRARLPVRLVYTKKSKPLRCSVCGVHNEAAITGREARNRPRVGVEKGIGG